MNNREKDESDVAVFGIGFLLGAVLGSIILGLLSLNYTLISGEKLKTITEFCEKHNGVMALYADGDFKCEDGTEF